MRNSVYYGARGFARELNRQRNQHERSLEAAARREAKEAVYQGGFETEEKENKRLELQKNMCFHYATLMMKQKPYFDFELLKEKFEPTEFEYEKEPEYIDRSGEIYVPKEKRIEKLFKSIKNKRIEQEEKKQKQIEEDKIDFENRKKEYEVCKKNALEEHEKAQKDEADKIKIQNQNVEDFKKRYLDNEKEAQKDYLITLLTNYLDEHKTKMFSNVNLEYTSENKLLIVEVEMADVFEYFEYSHCKYVKSRNEIDCFYYKESEVKKEFTSLLPKIALGFSNLFLGNDLNNSINDIVINIIYKDVYLISLKMNKAEYKELDFSNLGDFNKALNEMRIFKSLQTGIKVFDYIK